MVDRFYLDFALKYFVCPTFTEDHWFSHVDNYKPVQGGLRACYLPDERKSCKFRTADPLTKPLCAKGKESKKNWTELAAFETSSDLARGSTVTAFVGSHAFCMEWMPLPSLNQSFVVDYLLVFSVGRDHAFRDYEQKNFIQKDLQPAKGLLQVWSYSQNQLRIECCFAIDHAVAYSIEVAKGGTAYSLTKERLGLVALGFDDGFIKIYSIPFISSLEHCDQTPPVYHINPVAILEPPFSQPIVCRSLSWSFTDNQRFLAAGYGNGAINYYDLETKSFLLRSFDSKKSSLNIKPQRSWAAHGAIVTSLQILPLEGSNIIISGSWDRNIYLWNLKDPRIFGTTVIHRSMVDCLCAPPLFPDGIFLSFDYSFLSSNQSTLCFKKIIDEFPIGDCRTLISLPSEANNTYSMAMSNFFNALLYSDSAGRASLHYNFRARREKRARSKKITFCPLFTTHLESIKEEIMGQKKEGEFWLINSKAKRERSYTEMVSNYGLVFYDTRTNAESIAKSVSKTMDKGLKARIADYPICCIRKSIWSPNIGSMFKVANLLHCGLIRVSDTTEIFNHVEKIS